MKAILERRRIRKYTGETVSKEKIEELLKAAMASPSAIQRFLDTRLRRCYRKYTNSSSGYGTWSGMDGGLSS